MAKKWQISKADQQEYADGVAKLGSLHRDLLSQYESLQEAINEYNDRVEAYNDQVTNMEAWCEDIANAFEGKYDDMSEKWQESDGAVPVREFIEFWRDLMMNVAQAETVTEPDEPEAPDLPSEPLWEPDA